MNRIYVRVFPRTWWACLLALCWMTAFTHAAERREYFFDIYGGNAGTQGDTIRGEYQYVSIFGNSSREHFRARYGNDESPVYGARFGRWMDAVPWLGFALDGSYFIINDADIDLDMDVFVLTPLVMARYPIIVSDDFPDGRLQPYLAAGTATAWVDTSLTYDDGSEQTSFSDFAEGIGPDLRIGSTVMFSKNLGVFIEYRYTYIKVESNMNDDWVFLGGQITGMETTLSTQYITGGISIRF